MPADLITDGRASPGVRGHRLSSSRRAGGRPRTAALVLTLVLAAAGAGLCVLYWCQSRTAPVNSDGAANVLQAQAILGGNPLLRGWWTSDVSFYTTELPEYALVTAVRGVTPAVVHWCGALSYTLTVLLAALLARGGIGGSHGNGNGKAHGGYRTGAGWLRPAVTVAIMLAPSLLGGTEVFLENPDHAGTAVPVLAVLLIVDRAGERRLAPLAVLAASLLLALAQLGDELTLAAATVPLALVCAARLSRRPDAALLAAAAGAAAAAWLAGLALRAAGGFTQQPLGGVTLAGPGHLAGNARTLWQSLVLLFGANQPGAPRQPQTIAAHPLLAGLAWLHVTGLLLAGAGLAAGIAAVAARRADRVTAVLVTAVAMVTAAALATTLLRSLSNAHEVAVLLPLGAVLAGRALPSRSGPLATPSARRGLAAIAACWLALGLAGLGYAASWPATAPAQQPVAAWLAGQHQHAGLAGYWQAAATTVTSGGRVLVAPVTLAAGGAAGGAAGQPRTTAEPDRWESFAGWYQPGQHAATFVIAAAGPGGPGGPGGGLPSAAVRAVFGPPAAQHQIGQQLIMLYRYNLLTRLSEGVPGRPGTGGAGAAGGAGAGGTG